MKESKAVNSCVHYRACRRSDGTLGDCRDPKLTKAIKRLERERIITSLGVILLLGLVLGYLL